MDDLDKILEGDDLDVSIEQPPPVVDDDLARRVLARRNRRLAELAAFEDAWNRQMEPLLLHRQHVTETIGREVERCEALLADMLEARRADDPKLTAVHLPGGTLRSRAQQPEWTYEDPDAVVAWAQDRDDGADLLRTRVEPDKRAIKGACSIPSGLPGDTVPAVLSDGEIIPGVKVTYRPRKLVIER